MTTSGIYAADGSQRVTVANVDGGTIGLTVDTTGLATEATLADVATEATLADVLTSIGAPTDAAWNGTDPSASLISVMKGVYGLL